MPTLEELSNLLPPEAAPQATDRFAQLSAMLPDEKPEEPNSWLGGITKGTVKVGQAIKEQAQQGYSQIMLEQTAQRADDRKRIQEGNGWSKILEDAQLSSGLRDMQGRPMKTSHGGEYVDAAARWLDAQYGELIGTDDEAASREYAAAVKKNMDELAAVGFSQSAEKFQKKAMIKDASFGETLANWGGAIYENPLGAFAWSLENAARSAPQMAAGALTTLITKNPAAGIAVMGGGSAVTERYLSPGEFFEEKGLKLDRAADREKLLNDPKLMQEAAERGVIRALVVGSFDALSGGLAGKAIAGNPFVEALAQTATQAVLGASGEALARGAAGQKMDWNEVFGEGLGEMATLPVDMIVAGRGGAAQPADTGPGQAGDVIPPEEEGLPAEGAGVDGFKAEPLFRPAPPALVPDSPRLTESDRSSPIPDDVIDSGKSLVETATGKPSTITTTQEVNGQRQVVDVPVADIVAADKAKTAALIEQITAGVSPAGITAPAQPAAPPASAGEVGATPAPLTANAPVAPSMETAEPELAEARFQTEGPVDELTRRYGPKGTQARTLEEARLAKGDQPMVTRTERGDTIEVRHPYYETFEAWIDGKKVGELNVSPQGPHASSVQVQPAAQRRGVASALYTAAEAALGRPMTPSPMGMSGDAIGFWKKRFSEMEPAQKQSLLQQALDKGIEQKIPKSARERVDALGYIEPPDETRLEGEDDKTFAKRVVDKRPPPETLPEKYEAYFLMDDATVVDIGDLVSSKTDEENKKGGGNAVKRMAAAANGELSRRGPITVEPITSGPDAGKYLITDGNGTFTSVKEYGWKSMPVVIQKEGTAAAEEAAPAKAAPAAAEPAPQMTKSKFAEDVAKFKQRAAERKAKAKELAASGKPVRLKRADGQSALVGEDMSEKGRFRITFFDKEGTPSGHSTRDTMEEAVDEGLRERYAAEPAAQKTGEEALHHHTAFTGENATTEQMDAFYVHPFKTVDALLEDAQARQDELGAAAKELADRIEGVTLKNPGLKERETLEDKIPRKGYVDAGQLTDAIRLGFEVSEPGLASEIIRGLARHFEVLDEGWGVLDTGYFDRKVLVRFDDGRIGEVQFWEPHLIKAKSKGYPHLAGGTKGGDLYDEWRAIKDSQSPRKLELYQQMNELYGYALSLATDAWSRVVREGKLSKPSPKYLNLKRQFSSDISRQELTTSSKSASTQSESGLSSALASTSEKTTGRLSQLQNFTGTPPFNNNVVQPEESSKPLPEAKFQARTLREGTETAESIGLPPTKQVTTSKGKLLLKKISYTTRKIAAALQARQRAKYGTIARNDRTPETSDRIADWIVDEVDFEMQPGREAKSGVGWYSSKFQRALDAFAGPFPELVGKDIKGSTLPGVQRLENKKNARDFLTALIAVTSDGAVVAQNFAHAARLYEEFRQTGSIDADKITEGGDRTASMKTNVGNILHMLAQYGPEGMHRTLMREETVSKLKQEAAQTGTQFGVKLQAHLRMPMAALVFGPKLGAFYANLMGSQGYLTMDRWWSRTFNRYRGQLLTQVTGLADRPTDARGNKIGLARFKEMIGQPNLSDEEALVEAMRHSKLYEEKGFKNGTDIEKTANTIRKDSAGTEDSPFGAVDRTFMIETVERARQKLADRGVTISLADIQAILWYYEKRLYSELGARETADISYEEVATRIAGRTDPGNRPGGPDLSATVEGPDGARFSLREAGRDQDAGRTERGRGGADRQRPDAGAAEGARQDQEVTPLPGLYELYPSSVGPNADVTAAKQAYMESTGQPYRRQAEYVEADPERGKNIAEAFDAMEHNPSDPQVAAAYRAMIDETVAQYHALQEALNLKIEFIEAGQENPYGFSPRLALEDVLNNGHLWVFPTEGGFGSINEIKDNPLLEQTDIVIDGRRLVANDVFRIVHDIFGHGPEGAGFGPTGEENAWQSHVRMYSPLAARAMTTETRGQNSWVNFGPHGAANRKNPKDTIFADQKIGLLPDWVMTDGLATDEGARFKTGTTEPIGSQPRSLSQAVPVQGGIVHFGLSPAFVKKADAVWAGLRKILDGYGLTNVDLAVWQQIFADMENGAFGVDGVYMQKMIHYAMDSQSNPDAVMHHEVVHALWDHFTETEKAILTRKAKKSWITDRIKSIYPESVWEEEGVAHAHAEWKAGAQTDGVIAKIFRKIDQILKAVARALTGQDFRSAEDIFRQMSTGEIGRRGQATSAKGPGFALTLGGDPALKRRITAAIDQAYSQLYPNPFNENQVGFGNKAGTGMVMMELENYGTSLYVKWLTGTPQKSGMGSQGIAYLKDLARKHNVPLTLIPWKNGQLGEKKLLGIFHKWGFKEGKQGLLWWHPEAEAKLAVKSEIRELYHATSAAKGTRLEPRTPVIPAHLDERHQQPAGVYFATTPEGGSSYVSRARKKTGEARLEKVPVDVSGFVNITDAIRKIRRRKGVETFGQAKVIAMRDAIANGAPGVIFDGDAVNQPEVAVFDADRLYAEEAMFSNPATTKGEARFNLQTPPHTPVQSQVVTQGFLNRGQPVDRAIRVAFDLLGGLDNQNRWRPTKRLTDKLGPQRIQAGSLSAALGGAVGGAIGGPIGGVLGAVAAGTAGAYILGSAPAPTNGKFGWFAGMAENAKRGLIDNYGLDPEYIKAYEKSELGKTAMLRDLQGILKVLSNAGVGTPEAKVLKAVLTDGDVSDADMVRLAQPIRKAIDDMGAEAVSLGLISAESFERNRGSYLHRVYMKNEADQNSLAGWVSKQMTNRRKKIIGDQLKGRGMFWDLDTDRLMKDAGEYYPLPTKGDKWVVLDNTASTGKVMKRVYFPAGVHIPMEFTGPSWVNRGTWEVRQIGDSKATLWRDYTKDEREKMGEIVDARYTIAKTFMLMANDLSTGRFFREVSEKEEWTSATQPPDGTWKDSSDYNQYWNDPEIQWVKVPDSNISDTGGKKRWGALANKWVRAEIWRDLNEVAIASKPGVWRTLLTQWKKNKTARNPVVHMNNVMSNMMFMDMADVRLQDLVAGIRAFASGGKDYEEALNAGAFGGDMVSQEIRDQVLKPILEEIAKQTSSTANPFLARAGALGVFADKLWTWAKNRDEDLLRAYQAEDQIFRMAAYMRRRSQGESPEVAALNARDQFLNYDIRAPWIRAMRNTALPFISYTYRAIPKLAESISHRPWKLAKYMAVAFAVNALGYLWDDGDDDEEEKERAALRKEEQGYTWLGVQRMLRMPFRDAHGLPVFFDVRRWIPAGDIFDTSQGHSALPIPAPLQFGGPLQLAFEFLLNRQAFTGDDITNDLTQDTSEKFTSVADWAWKAWAPNAFWVPNSWYWTKISDAMHGATDTAGRPYSVPQALASSFGIKLKPLDVDDGIKWHFYDFQKVQKALRQEMRRASTRLERGLISQSAFDAEAASIMEKFGTLGEKVDAFSEKTATKRKQP